MSNNTEIVLAPEKKNLFQYSEQEFNNAVERILMHKQSKLKFQSVLSSANGAILSKDYSLGRISHNYFSNCTFDSASLQQVAGAGSIFKDVSFLCTNLQGALFQHSTFEHCNFRECQLASSNLSESYFMNTSWIDCVSESFNMGGSYFKQCKFFHTRPGNLAEAYLDDVFFEDVRITNMNMEFATFDKVHAQNVVLPFSQMSYVFNGLSYLFETSDEVRISSHINDAHSISVSEYIEVLKDMEIFFSYKKEYFPLANILLAFKRYNEALDAILLGITQATLQRDFRMCKYYCKLLTDNGKFDRHTLSEFYQRLCSASQIHSLSEAQHYQYMLHIPEIRSMLLENPEGYPHVTLTLYTEISDPESYQVSVLLASLDEFIHLKGSRLVNPSITISHNSPPVFAINLCGIPQEMLAVCAFILVSIAYVCKNYNEIAQAIVATQTIKENAQKLKLQKLEQKKIALEIQRLEIENEELIDRVNARNREITKSGIIISRAEITAQDFDALSYLRNRQA